MVEKIKIDQKIYESLKALFINVKQSFKIDYSKSEVVNEDKYFVYARRGIDKDIFYSIVDKYYHEKDKYFVYARRNIKGEWAAYQYLAFKIFGVVSESAAKIIETYIKKDTDGVLFFDGLSKLGEEFPEYKYKSEYKYKNEENKYQETVYILEQLIVKYFKNYKEIMKQEEIDRHDYRYDFLFRKQHSKERIEKKAENIEAALEYFNEEKKEKEDE